jgi:hypothetical protein
MLIEIEEHVTVELVDLDAPDAAHEVVELDSLDSPSGADPAPSAAPPTPLSAAADGVSIAESPPVAAPAHLERQSAERAGYERTPALTGDRDAMDAGNASAASGWSPEDAAFLAAVAVLPADRMGDTASATAATAATSTAGAQHDATAAAIPAPRPVARPQPARHPTRTWRPRKRRPLFTLIEVMLVLLVAFGATYAVLDARARLDNAKVLAHAGLQRIEDVRALFSGPDKLADALKPGTLTQAATDLTQAQGDFARLRGVLQAGTFALAARVPFASGPVGAALALAAAADEACQGGLLAVRGMELVAPIMAGGFFAGGVGSANALTTATVTQLSAALDGALHHLDIAVGDARQADLAALPASLLSAQQRRELQQAIAQWPSVRPLAAQADAILAGAPALLGLNSPTSYLIELMDRTELRPGGGFIGNYAVMTLSQGKVQPFTISDTYLLDKPYLSTHGGYSPAPPAFSWWRWADYYGLRDSNFSADFPTTAQQGMQELAREGGPSTQGVIALSVPAIARVIAVVGAIPMPLYHQTVTAQNLESLIHYYQEAVGHDPLTGLPRSDLLSSSRKRFTALLARALLDKLHALSSAQLLALGQVVVTSLRLKELQVYVAVPQVESLLTQQGLDGAVTHGPGDGVTIVDANATANKANQFVTTTYRDQVSLDAHGTAIHQLTITYQFNAADPALLYGPDLYETYLRVYVPPGAQLTHLDGLNNLFGDDQINRSDLSWRQMWGGYVIVYNHAPYTLHLTWTVPHAATDASATGRWSYRLTYQHQSGANQVLTLSVAVPGQSHPAIQANAPLDADQSFVASYHGA